MTAIEKYIITLEEILAGIKAEEREKEIKEVKNINGKITIKCKETQFIDATTLESAASKIREIINYLKKPNDKCIGEKLFFVNYDSVTYYMKRGFGIKPSDAYQILACIIERNYKISSLTNERAVLDIDELRAVKFKKVTVEEVIAIFKDQKKLRRFSLKTDLDEREKEIQAEIESHLDEFVFDYTEFCKYNEKIYLNFIKKVPKISLEDIIDFIVNLKKLGVVEETINELKGYFLSLFKTNINSDTKIYDLELNQIYIDMLTDDEKERDNLAKLLKYHNNVIETQKRNELDREKNSEDNNPENTSVKKSNILTEKEVRELKKYLRKFYDTYNVRLVQTPSYSEFLQCIEVLERLEETPLDITRLINFSIAPILELKDYFNDYEELINFISILIKYKISRKDIDSFIIKYKNLKPEKVDLVEFFEDSLDEICLYDESLGNDVKFLLDSLEANSKEDYDAIVHLLEDCLKEFEKYSARTEYEYNLGLKKLGR